MLDSLSLHHLQRIRTATTQRVGRKDIARWIEQNTYINGRNFSFLHHEYQERILQEDAIELVIKNQLKPGSPKCQCDLRQHVWQ